MVKTELSSKSCLITSYYKKDVDGKDVHCLSVGQFTTDMLFIFGVGNNLPEDRESIAAAFDVPVEDVT